MASSISPAGARDIAAAPPARPETKPKAEAPPPKPAAPEPPRENKAQAARSESSQASERVGNELNAQRDQARTSAPETATKYIAEADIDGDGTISEAEDAAYKKLLANAEAKVSSYKSVADAGTGQSGSISVSA